MNTGAILAERARTHGDYAEHANLTQSIKLLLRSAEARRTREERITAEEWEALDMIAHKIGRILAGNPHHEDHWRDIAGYATLVADRLERL